MVISAIWSILEGQNCGPYIRNPVYLVLLLSQLLLTPPLPLFFKLLLNLVDLLLHEVVVLVLSKT